MARLARTSATAPKVCRLSRLGCNPIRRPLNSNPWLKCLWIGLRLVFDFQGALLGLMSGFVRGALAGLLHMMPPVLFAVFFVACPVRLAACLVSCPASFTSCFAVSCGSAKHADAIASNKTTLEKYLAIRQVPPGGFNARLPYHQHQQKSTLGSPNKQ